MTKTRKALLNSILSLMLCFSMLLGTTYAWFTDSVTSANNIIQSGRLKAQMEYSDDLSETGWKDASTGAIFDYQHWEPGFTQVKYIKVKNTGNLAFKYLLNIAPNGAVTKLAEVIDVYCIETSGKIDARTGLTADKRVGTLFEIINGKTISTGALLPEGKTDENNTPSGAVTLALAMKMREDAGNEYQGMSLSANPEGHPTTFAVKLLATQNTYESDSFDDQYDAESKWPGMELPGGNVSESVGVNVENGVVKDKVTVGSGEVSATVPAGVAVNDGTAALTLSVVEKTDSDSNVTVEAHEALMALDVHIEGVSANNTTPITVKLGKVLPEGMNLGNVALYHVENGSTNPMTQVMSLSELDEHNEFYYDPATGEVTVAMATFSEVAMVADTENAWEGNFDYSWYTNAVAPLDGEATADYVIANADQLAAFGAIVGGMDGQTQDSFSGKTVKLLADINLGDKESENNPDIIFYPIGYYNSEGTYERTNTAITSGLKNFEGTFDGNGHTISNFYQNTWEMKGDHDWYSPEEQYYRDGMGLFGKVYGGTVKNLTVSNFSSDGEIATTGVIAAYADGATFENIAIFNCNPRVYNIGNGGIVGCVGWYAKEAGLKTTFTNITVDNSNKISALWGSYDVACGGIVGQYYPTSGQTSAGTPKNAGIELVNCHVSAQMDVYNDVCGNYQYYAYRYAGMMIGSIRENTATEDGKTIPNMTGITATGCTVNYGDWNDYYYCEFEKNGHPSYSGPDDYKFSRVPHSELKFTDSNGNGLVDADERASVTGCKHDHTDAENNQAIYLPFHQLFTGYGWGVNSIGLEKYSGIVTNLDITEGDQEESVKKFEGKVSELANNRKYKLGDIFTFVNNGVEPVPGALTVSVNNLDENNPVSAVVDYDTTNWENGTLTLTGTGKVKITIQDYYFCTPTTITVNVTERQSAEKFETKFTGDFLYRVGNQNAVKLDSLFKAKEGVTVGTVSVTVEALNGTAASGTYTSNATWTNGTIQFSGTGVVKVTITDNDYCIATELILEVVDAKNATSAASATANNVVLLNDTSGTFTVSNGYTFYGNGFKVTCAGKGYRLNFAGMYGGFIEVNSGGVLDNVQVFCDIYPVALLYSSEAKEYKNEEVSTTEKAYYNYQLSAVAITGNGSMITNSYVYGGRNNIYVGDGNVSIENTTTKNGVLSNIQIKTSDASSVTLKDITTIQSEVKSTYDDTKTMLGCGIIVGDVSSVSNPNVIIQGKWDHYNWVTAANATNTSNTYAKEIINQALSESDYVHRNDADTVNLGMIVLNQLDMSIDDQRSVKDNYMLSPITMRLKDPDTGLSGDVNGQVYSVAANKGNPNSTAPEYVPIKNLEYKPTAKKDTTVGGKADANDGGNDSRYCYWEGNLLKLMYKENESAFTLDIAELVGFSKFGYTLNATPVVTKNGAEVSATDGKVTFTDAGTYVITYTVTDPYNYDKDGNQVANATEWTFTYEVEVSVVKSAGKNAEFNEPSTIFYGNYGKTSSVFDPDFHYCMPFMKDVTITDYAEDGVTASTFDATKNIISINVEGDKTSGTVTLKYLDGRELVVATSGHSVGLGSSGNTISVKSYNGQLWICTDGVSNNATTGTWKVTSYKFTGNNGVPVEYATTRTCNFDSASTTNSPQNSWSSFGSPSVDSIKYTVTYDANGGSCTKAFAYATTSSAAVTLPTPSRSGYIFSGWYTAASGGTRVGGAGDSYTPSSNITLYAQWGKPCTVTYNANGGSCGTASEKYTGTALTLPTPTRDGYWFIGWYDAASGGTKIGDAGATYNPSGETTLYAHWQEQVEYIVTYNANGGTCGTASATYQGTALTLPTPTRTGYKFLGWYTAASGGNKIGDAGASYTPSANVTLYAQWEQISYTITISKQDNATVTVDKTTAHYNDTISVTVSFSQSNSKTLTVKDASGNTVLSKSAAGTYTFTMPASNVTIEASSSSGGGCVTPDTLVTLADGSKKRIDSLVGNEILRVWDFYKGEYTIAPIGAVINHGYSDVNKTILQFADGTTINVLRGHGFYDVSDNKFVIIDEHNAADYIGHKFVKYNTNDSCETTVLVDYSVETIYTEVWTIVSAIHFDCILNGLLTLSPTDFADSPAYLMPFEIGEGMKYDASKMQADIEKYGLYTYEDFADCCTYEQFVGFSFANWKVAVEKGYITWEDILYLISTYVN